MIALDSGIRGDLGWQLQGNWNPTTWSKGSIKAYEHLLLMPWGPIASDPPMKFTSDCGIREKYASGAASLPRMSESKESSDGDFGQLNPEILI